MSVFDKMQAARSRQDAQGYADMMAPNFEFVRHQNGTTLNKAQTTDMLNNMLASGGKFGEARCVYENDDICVVHSINDYPDGTREAVMAVYSLKDGQIVRLETGATPLSS